MSTNLQETADLVTFTEEILNGKLYFLCSVSGHFSTSATEVEKCNIGLRWVEHSVAIYLFLLCKNSPANKNLSPNTSSNFVNYPYQS